MDKQLAEKVSPASSKERLVAKAMLERGSIFGRLKPPAPSELRKAEFFSEL
jgi:hypothetical protein